jgi:stage II sporulation protein D
MPSASRKSAKYIIITILFLCIFWGAPAEFGKEQTFFHGYGIQKPVVKIGLGVNLRSINICSSSGMKVYEVNASYKLLADDADEVYIRGRREKLTEKFVIQVARSKEREEAELIAQDLRQKIEAKVDVVKNTENEVSGSFLVKVGDFLTRGDALNFIKKLNEIGIAETWILREEITEEESRLLWILVNDELKGLSNNAALYFVPSNPQSFLSFNGRDYRGMFVLKATPKGIVLINILNLEDYLKSVVPSELSPYTYGELEAHKAQAVAARSYAIRFLGLNKELGFDLGASPKAQFYQGMGAEHPLSSKAVELTHGEVARYRGRVINALYTSTCGGMTEDVENIFTGPALPYLRSTECVYEKKNEWLLKSRNIIEPIHTSGRNISPEIAFLISLKVIPSEINPDYYREEGSFTEAIDWINNALDLLGRKNEKFTPEASSLNFVTLGNFIIDGFDWHNRVENLLYDTEKDFIMRGFDNLKSKEKNRLAYLTQAGIFPASEDIKNLDRHLSRGELAFCLGKVIQSYQNITHQGIFKSRSKDMIEMEEEKEKKQFLLSPDIFLLRRDGSDYFFASHVYILAGDEVRVIEREGEVRLLEVIYPSRTNIMDRSSPFNRWELRISREALEKRINQYYPLGKLEDIIPQKRGNSQRVIKILIKGKETKTVVKGLRIRRVLGLKETLFVIDREYDEESRITHFIFYGRGFGHGVGLCQVGAFGMAQAGADYKKILKKYYRGIKISKAY